MYSLFSYPMKYLLFIILALSTLISITPTSADYFNEEIVGADPETGILQDIHLNAVHFRDSREVKRYNNTIYFVNNIKTEAVNRFDSGEIPLYRRYDIITNLDSFVYTMNQYFLYQKRYEQTKNAVYKENARYYLEDSKWAYNRLRASLKKSTY